MASQDLVYEDIKGAIQSGSFLPGHRLVESELSERFDAPRARVRSALFLLEHDGLIEHKRHRGATVRAIDQTEAREIIETRSALEGMAARRAAEKATERDDLELNDLVARMRDRLDAGSLTEASDVNMGIHQVIMRIADQQTITRLVASLNGNLVRYRYWTMFVADRPELSFAEHKAIVDAILARNPDAAEFAMRNHLANVWSTMHDQVIPDLPEI